MTTRAAEAFLAQNEDVAAVLDPDDLATIDLFAEHHAGGLFVLWRPIERLVDGPDLSVKMHDSWGGDDGEGRNIVVHVYSTEDDSHDVCNFYETGHEAIAAFLAADENTKEA